MNTNIQKAFKAFISTALVFTAINVKAADEKSLEARVSELEAQSMLNIFSFGGLLETKYTSVTAKRTAAAPFISAIDESTNYLSLKSSLNVNANISDKLKFYSRYSAAKLFNKFNTSGSDSNYALNDEKAGRGFDSSAVYVEKAYADYTFFKNDESNAVFSFGRLPTTDGPPLNLVNGRPRQGTFSFLSYNIIFDGMGLSYNRKINDTDTVSARLLYTPFSNYNKGTLGSDAYLKPATVNSIKQQSFSDITSVLLEYSKTNASFADNLSLIYQGVQSGELYLDGTSFGGTGNAIVKLENHSLTLITDNVLNTNIDLGLSYYKSTVKNSGTMTISAMPFYGLGASSSGQQVDGTSTLTNIKYRFNNKYALGVEYFDNKDGYPTNYAADDLTGYYGTQGTAYQVYALIKPESELTFRLGYTKQSAKKTAFTVGPLRDTDQKIDTYYANVRLDF